MDDNTVIFATDENGKVYSYLGSIGEALIRQGVIVMRDAQWRIKATDVDIVTEKLQYLSVCDFCSMRPAAFDIDAAPFMVSEEHGTISEDGWYACEPCGLLIEQHDQTGLLKRMLAHTRTSPVDEAWPHVVAYARLQQERFWQHFKSIKRIEPKPYGH